MQSTTKFYEFNDLANLVWAFWERFLVETHKSGYNTIPTEKIFYRFMKNPQDRVLGLDLSYEFRKYRYDHIEYLLICIRAFIYDDTTELYEEDIAPFPVNSYPYLMKWIWFDHTGSFPTEEAMDAVHAIAIIDIDQAIAFIKQTIELGAQT